VNPRVQTAGKAQKRSCTKVLTPKAENERRRRSQKKKPPLNRASLTRENECANRDLARKAKTLFLILNFKFAQSQFIVFIYFIYLGLPVLEREGGVLGTGMIGREREDVVIAKAAGTAFGDPKALKRARPKSRVASAIQERKGPPPATSPQFSAPASSSSSSSAWDLNIEFLNPSVLGTNAMCFADVVPFTQAEHRF
jgi:hypothetical protein